jgi:hypothetical protein
MNIASFSLWTIFRYSYIFVGYLRLMKNCVTHIWIVLLAFAGLVSGCETFDKPEPMPVFLDIDQARVALNKSGSITTTLGVKDLWVDYGVSRLGVFRQPSIVPVIPGESTDSIALAPGVFKSGLSSSRTIYPFLRPLVVPLDAEPLDTLKIRPVFSYYADTVIHFPFDESFEGASMTLEDFNSNLPSTTTLRTTRSDVFMGTGAGRADFNASQYNLEMIGSSFMPLPQSGINDIYMEITYKNTVSFTVGLLYATASDIGEIPAGVFFRSEDEWNTAYVHVNAGVRGILGTALFKPFIRASSFDASTNTAREGFILIDNFRIIHFQ